VHVAEEREEKKYLKRVMKKRKVEDDSNHPKNEEPQNSTPTNTNNEPNNTDTTKNTNIEPNNIEKTDNRNSPNVIIKLEDEDDLDYPNKKQRLSEDTL